ncbi:TetR/AcrR family transcriptional regulator [Clostridium sp. P21]|uniref:TetR/AcrR family transcriptional regulator n=1 Tax=Clostridium muellerianum TaxID=2716538 RepID=A0A7Y0HLD4_9CLOT|nr:TetR/AcrR family transcriptional regulator [Clostridium muellerianum]NMM61784.1 TetR/AcrR family transcriptional regulator [Clostridium muellerianum]
MKERILDAVYRLVKVKGINGFTMNDISKELHIGKQTIYTYFKSKDELMIELVRSSLEDNKTLTEEAVAEAHELKEKLKAALISYHKYKIPLELLEEIRKIYPELWGMLEEQRNFKLKIVRDILDEGIEDGEVSKKINPQIINYLLDKVTLALLNDEFLQKNNTTLNQALEELINLIFYGILIR